MTAHVSVIVPVFNGERYLRQALESALCQTHRPVEVIVADDGSTDGTATVAASLPVTYLRQENRGPGAARNAAVSRASGDFLAFLDSDDVWLPDKLAIQIGALYDAPAAGYALCYLRYLLDSSRPVPRWYFKRGPPEGEGGYAPSCWLVRRSAWDRVGPFQTARLFGEDFDWMSRAKEVDVRAIMVTDTLVLRRIHDDQLVSRTDEMRQGLLDTLRASVHRKQTVRRSG